MNFGFLNGKKFFTGFIAFLCLVTIAVSIQSYMGNTRQTPDGFLSDYNNYLIFKYSAKHLFEGKDLYRLHRTEHFDYYKYSPLFALLMAPFSFLPNWLGLILWNLLNLLALIIGLKSLPGLSRQQIVLIILISFFELLGSLMNEQSNALMVGLMVLGIAKIESDKPLWGSLFLVLSVYIKLFSIVAFMLILFYPSRIKNIAYSILWFVICAILPIVVLGWGDLVETYASWLNLLNNDYSDSVGYSVLGILTKWFNYSGSRNLVFFIGVILMCIPIIKLKSYDNRAFRYAVLSAILIWVIIFNHKAESPTFVIATTGIGLYFVTRKFTITNKVLLVFSILFVSLIYSDLVPGKLKDDFFYPYFIKAVPCIIVWVKIIYEVSFNKLHLNPDKTQL